MKPSEILVDFAPALRNVDNVKIPDLFLVMLLLYSLGTDLKFVCRGGVKFQKVDGFRSCKSFLRFLPANFAELYLNGYFAMKLTNQCENK